MSGATRRCRIAVLWMLAGALISGCGGGGGGSATSIPHPPVLTITTTSLPNTVQGQSYSQTLQATGGTPPYIWGIAPGGSLAPGLLLSSDGVLGGMATDSGNCVIRVTDSGSPAQTAQRSIPLVAVPPLTFTAVEQPAPPSVRYQYRGQVRVQGGGGSYSWNLQSGSVPPGLMVFGSDGQPATSGTGDLIVISGIPTMEGDFSFALRVADTGMPQQEITTEFTLSVVDLPEIPEQQLTLGLVNQPYQATLQAIGGKPPYSWSNSANGLPQGLQLAAATGVISGTPTESWNQTTSFTVSDSSNPSRQASTMLKVPINPSLGFTDTRFPDAALPQMYDQDLPFEGGLPPYTLELLAGSLPPGLGIAGNRPAITGLTSALGTYNFTLKLVDSESPAVAIQQDFSLRVNPVLLYQNFFAVASGLVGTPYSYQLQPTGGLLPLHYEWNTQSIPAFPDLNSSTGVLSGTPTVAGFRILPIRITDSANPAQVVTLQPTVNVYDLVKLVTSSLPPVGTNVFTSIQLIATGGTAHYSWSIASGNLPQGFTLSSSGVLSGQAAEAGQFPFVVRVHDDASMVDNGPPSQDVDFPRQLTVSAAPGRNDSVATATLVSNGTYTASISPYADPPNGVGNPDSDYYRLTANPGAVVTVETRAMRLTPPSPLDSVIEMVDSSAARLTTCSPVSSTSGPFNLPCMNDDIQLGIATDSKLTLQIPPGASGPQTFFVRVLDFFGSARPDLVYTLTVSGAN